MRLVLLALMVVGCGHPGGDGASTGDDDVTIDAGGGSSGSGSDDGGGSGEGNDNGGVGSGGVGSGGDGTVQTGCPAPAAPSVTMAVNSSGAGPGFVFRAGNQILAKPVIDEAHYWLRWTGSGWNSELIPWPANLPTIHNHYISRVVQLATTRALIFTDDRWIMTYDGTTMSPAIQPPSAVGLYIWGLAQDAGGAYHLFSGAQEWITKPDGTWYPPAPIPIPMAGNSPNDVTAAAAIMRNGRVVVEYIDMNLNASVRHAHLVSRPPGGAWTDDVNLTPTWAITARDPILYAPPGGGIAINVTGTSTYYKVPALWRSTDGVTLGDYETLSIGVMLSFAGECLDSLVINGTGQSTYDLYERQGYSWVSIAGHDGASVYPNQIAVASLANGKTFWVIGRFNGTDYLVSP